MLIAICKINFNTAYNEVLKLKSNDRILGHKATEYEKHLSPYILKRDNNIIITTTEYIVMLYAEQLEIFNKNYQITSTSYEYN